MAFQLTCLELRRAYKLPFSGPTSLARLMAGTALWLPALVGGWLAHDSLPPALSWTVFALLAAPALSVTAGYCLRVIRAELTASPGSEPRDMPAWGDLRNLAADGLKLLAWTAIYAAFYAAFVFALRAVTGMPLLELGRMKEAGEPSNITTTLLLFLAVVLFCNVIPCLACRLAETNKFGAGKQFWTMLKTSFDDRGAFRDAITGIYLFFVPVSFSIVTVVLFPPLLFAWLVVSANLFAQAYKRSSVKNKQSETADKPGDSPATGQDGTNPPNTNSAN